MPPRPQQDLGWSEVQAILDEELQRLPEKYRAPFVLCYLEGKSGPQAARELDLKEGTLWSRLTHARKQLQTRLTRRGITPSIALGAAALSTGAVGATIPSALAAKTIRAALLNAAGQMSAAGAVTGRVAALAQGATRALVPAKVKTVIVLVLALGVAAGLGLAAHRDGATPAQGTPAVAAALVSAGAARAKAPEAALSAVDRYGDPLPPGAVARLGTVRLRHGGRIYSLAVSPDSRILACGCSDGTVRLLETVTARERCRFSGHRGGVLSLAFSPDGRRLISGGEDTLSMVWDVFGLARPARDKPGELSAKDLAAQWAKLSNPDAARGHQAIAGLAARPKEALALLRERLRPAAEVAQERLTQLIAGLGSGSFAVRQQAARELAELGELAEPALRRLAESGPSLEARRRAIQLLEKLGPAATPESLRRFRASEVLELLATAEARRLLEELTTGAGRARVTREAAAALRRLGRRPAIVP